MLSARRKSDGNIVHAYFETKKNAPFFCCECEEEVVLKTGASKINHFAHANPLACRYAEGESETHRRCKLEIYEALRKHQNAANVVLEHSLGTVRPDVSAYIRGIPVAIEVQISSLSIDTIMHRTIEYFRKGIHVLWLLQWTPKLDSQRYVPRMWEKWIHAAYFGHIYYWLNALNVVDYHFDATLKSVPKTSWYSKDGKQMFGGGYTKRSKRFRTGVRGQTFNLAADFVPRERSWWEGNGVTVPDAKLFMQRYQRE